MGSFLVDAGDCLASNLSVMGKPLLVYNVEKILQKDSSISRILIPSGVSSACDILQRRFPSLKIEEYGDLSYGQGRETTRIPLNSAVLEKDGMHVIKPIVYPWDVLLAGLTIMGTEIRETSISENSSIAETTVVKGPCVIEDGVSIDDFNKIVGPAYFGKNSKIGTGNLMRNCAVGENTSVGFGCEVARSILAGNNRISHHDVILDSMIGQNTWMGAFVGTTNLLLNNEPIKFKLGEKIVSTGLEHFGAVIGQDCAIGAGVIILPGRSIPKNSIIQAGTVLSR
ncbi:MAG: hypothetical protein KGJ07_09920 [Patescibacteria group bacterium]|nr:hypothetical protein [Patescibacteria group bacterium]